MYWRTADTQPDDGTGRGLRWCQGTFAFYRAWNRKSELKIPKIPHADEELNPTILQDMYRGQINHR